MWLSLSESTTSDAAEATSLDEPRGGSGEMLSPAVQVGP